MAERYKCNTRFNRFINERAFNKPRRSYVLIDNVLSKTDNQEIQELKEEEDEAEERGSNMRSDPKKSDPEFSSVLEPGSDSVTVQDRESETYSSKNPTPRRSERIRRRPEVLESLSGSGYSYEQNHKKVKTVLPEPEMEPDPVSSISCTSPDEEVAYCLMSMKNDKWVVKDESFGEDDDEEEDEEEEEEEEAYSVSPENKKIDRKNRGRYKCETCNKLFRSYQALGGHRASHKKTHKIPAFEEQHETDDPKTPAEEKIHECPVCYRVFASGQALGGHKRSHVTEAAAAETHRRPPPTPTSATRKCNRTMIDLNLPAPMEEDE